MAHQLALITAIRKVISSIDNREQALEFFSDVINETELLAIVSEVFTYQSTDERLYYMRLEAIWILINLAFVPKREMAVICASVIPVTSSISESHLLTDLVTKKSIILSKLDNLIRE